jgi:hypothetical protein
MEVPAAVREHKQDVVLMALFVLVCVMVFSAIDSALGVGAILPGETAVVLAAIALAGDPGHVALRSIRDHLRCRRGDMGDHLGYRGSDSGKRPPGFRR